MSGSRCLPFRAKPGAVVETRIAQLTGSPSTSAESSSDSSTTASSSRPLRLFLVQTLGPTLFIVRQEMTTNHRANHGRAESSDEMNGTSGENTEPVDFSAASAAAAVASDAAAITSVINNESAPLASRSASISSDIEQTTSVLNQTRVRSKFKVAIGNPQRCSCGDKEICVHILFCMIKVLGVPADNPLAWQRALVEREINMVCSGQIARESRRREASNGASSSVPRHNFLRRRSAASRYSTQKTKDMGDSMVAQRKVIEDGDSCPVCLEDLCPETSESEQVETGQRLTYCRKGCGKNVHLSCVTVWAEHQNSIGKKITCPLCRVDWGPLALHTLRNGGEPPKKDDHHVGVLCSHCPARAGNFLVGVRYRCLICADYNLCEQCYVHSSNHAMHQFVQRKAPKEPWLPAPSRENRIGRLLSQRNNANGRGSQAMPESILSLQAREITPDDYFTLLSLDDVNNSSGASRIPSSSNNSSMQSRQTSSYGRSTISLAEYLVQTLMVFGGSKPSRRDLSIVQGLANSSHQQGCLACVFRVSSLPPPVHIGQQMVALPCMHRVHKQCLIDRFSRGKFSCPHPECPVAIFRGLLRKRRRKRRDHRASSAGYSSTTLNHTSVVSAELLIGPATIMPTSEGLTTTGRSLSAIALSRAPHVANVRRNEGGSGYGNQRSRQRQRRGLASAPSGSSSGSSSGLSSMARDSRVRQAQASENPQATLGISVSGSSSTSSSVHRSHARSHGRRHRQRALTENLQIGQSSSQSRLVDTNVELSIANESAASQNVSNTSNSVHSDPTYMHVEEASLRRGSALESARTPWGARSAKKAQKLVRSKKSARTGQVSELSLFSHRFNGSSGAKQTRLKKGRVFKGATQGLFPLVQRKNSDFRFNSRTGSSKSSSPPAPNVIQATEYPSVTVLGLSTL